MCVCVSVCVRECYGLFLLRNLIFLMNMFEINKPFSFLSLLACI